MKKLSKPGLMRALQSRREFLRDCVVIMGATAIESLSIQGQAARPKSAPASHLVRFGKTELFVSRLCQGTAFRQVTREAEDPAAQRILRYCLDTGINFFDTSEAYGWGGSEMALGKAIIGKRHEVVICSKASPGSEPDSSGKSAKMVFTPEILSQKLEGSLKRLGTDYIDLYLLHGPDEVTPAESIADSMAGFVKSGKIRYWGVSNHSASMVGQFVKLAKRKGKAPIAGLQDYYNIAAADRRDFMDRELFPLIDKGRLGLMAFSPLAEGRLAPGRSIPKGSPLESLAAELDRVAKEMGVTRPQVCIAWVLTRPQATVVLAGAEKPEHVADNWKGAYLTLPPKAIQALNAASDRYTQQLKSQPKQ